MREKNQLKKMNLLHVFMITVLMFSCWGTMVAQTGQSKTVRGVVVDKSGVTIPGVNITVKQAGGIGTISDFDGKFSIKVSEKATLVFTYIGYETREMVVGNYDNMRIS